MPRNFTLIPSSFSPFVVLLLMPSILLVVLFSWRTSGTHLLCLDRWTWRRKEGELRRRKTDYKGKKMMANLTRFGCMEWPFEMTVCWDVEMVICWNVDWLLSLRPFAEVACATYGMEVIFDRKCWWLMSFYKKIWSNECVWKSINGLRWRKEMIKWM